MAKNKHGVSRGLLDLLLVVFTGGLWLLWMLVRFLRNGRK